MASGVASNTTDGGRSAYAPSVRFVLRGHRRALAGMAASAYVGGIAEAVFLVTVTRIAFAITEGDERVGIIAGWFMSVNSTLALLVMLVLFRVGMAALSTWQAARMSAMAVADLQRRLAAAFLQAEWAAQQQQKSGSLQELLGAYSRQAASLVNSVGGGLVAAFNVLAMLGLALAVDPLGALVMLVAVVVLGSLVRPFRAAVRRRSRLNNEAGMDLATEVNEVSQLGMELHVFHVQDRAAARLGEHIGRSSDAMRRVQFANSMSSAIYVGLAYFALLGALAVVALSSVTSLTSLGAVMLVMLRSLSYGQAFQTAYIGVANASPAIEDLIAQLDRFHRVRRSDGDEPVGNVGAITVDRVTFAYTGEANVLRDLSLTIEPCEIVGIVGPSGGGKSTLVQLLLGLRHPQEGHILADGRDIRRFQRAEWARKVTFVPQSAHLIAGSIADNIRFMRRDVSDEVVERAARLAHVHAEIVAFPEGYDRSVGDQGGNLSGGQQQRICIARALVEAPDLLILDEPTSALDVLSEHLVRTTLLELKERMTVIVIAHRLSTLDICDRIMVIQDGELRGFDSPANLENSSTFYREALALSGLR